MRTLWESLKREVADVVRAHFGLDVEFDVDFYDRSEEDNSDAQATEDGDEERVEAHDELLEATRAAHGVDEGTG